MNLVSFIVHNDLALYSYMYDVKFMQVISKENLGEFYFPLLSTGAY